MLEMISGVRGLPASAQGVPVGDISGWMNMGDYEASKDPDEPLSSQDDLGVTVTSAFVKTSL